MIKFHKNIYHYILRDLFTAKTIKTRVKCEQPIPTYLLKIALINIKNTLMY